MHKISNRSTTHQIHELLYTIISISRNLFRPKRKKTNRNLNSRLVYDDAANRKV